MHASARSVFCVTQQLKSSIKCYQQVRCKKNYQQTVDKAKGTSTTALAERESFGFKNYAKKHRMYAQLNYQEWRFPQTERVIDTSCTRGIFQDYKEKSGGMKSLLRRPREEIVDMQENIRHKFQLKRKVKDFHTKRFPPIAQDLYIEAHNLLNRPNWIIAKRKETEERLHELVTEHAYKDMVQGLDNKTVMWKWIESIEPPRVVQVRCAPLIAMDNLFGQVTVRFHSKQTLAVYDRFGRLIFGSPDVPRNVLEFVVFERHISHPYGHWRIHGKTDSEQYAREPMQRTIAVVRPNQQKVHADEWHKTELEECHYKWYPYREVVKKKFEQGKRKHVGYKRWCMRRKRRVLYKQHSGLVRMRGATEKLVAKKTARVAEMRVEGRLPPSPETY